MAEVGARLVAVHIATCSVCLSERKLDEQSLPRIVRKAGVKHPENNSPLSLTKVDLTWSQRPLAKWQEEMGY